MVEVREDGLEDAERSAPRRASADRNMVISLFELDCIRYWLNIELILICLEMEVSIL